MKRSLFITGASGYIGTRLLQRMDLRKYARVVCLVRDPEASAMDGKVRKGVDLVVGDLGTPNSYLDKLRGCDTVMHLAAVTGKARPAAYFRVNRDGTRALVEAAKSEGVQNFLHVSTIAVKYSDQSRYFYAHSKKQAEKIVTNGELAYTILRPTIVTGPNAPVSEGLARMAGGPVMPVFGDGRPAVQPIFIDDLVDSILSIVEAGRFFGETIEIGGPEVLSIEELMTLIGRIRFDKPSRPVHLPLGPIRTSLALLERVALPILPMTSGQMALFANDSTIAPNTFVEDRREHMMDVEAALRTSASQAEQISCQSRLERECRVYCRYLIGRSPGDYIQEKYATYHSQSDAEVVLATDRFDDFLLRVSRISPLMTRFADSYTSLFRKHSVIRKKLVLLLGILECSPSTFQQLDAHDKGTRAWIYVRLLGKMGVHALGLAVATPVFAAAHVLMRIADGGPAEEAR